MSRGGKSHFQWWIICLSAIRSAMITRWLFTRKFSVPALYKWFLCNLPWIHWDFRGIYKYNFTEIVAFFCVHPFEAQFCWKCSNANKAECWCGVSFRQCQNIGRTKHEQLKNSQFEHFQYPQNKHRIKWEQSVRSTQMRNLSWDDENAFIMA